MGVPVVDSIVAFSMTESVTLGGLEDQTREVLTEATRLLGQLSIFTTQFHNFVNESGINIVVDASGRIGIDVLASLSDSLAQSYANRVEVLDSLIHNHGHRISDLLARGSEIEEQILELNPDYVSQLSDLRARFNQLMSSYRYYS